MGQYYKPLALSDDKKSVIGWVYSHAIKYKFTRADGQSVMLGNGLKLMEHSYLNNEFVRTVEKLMVEGGAWYKQPIVWAGDYADEEPISEGEKFAGAEAVNLYHMADDNLQTVKKRLALPKKFQYIVNHDKKEYVDKAKCTKDEDGYTVHPLPLLTCEGNGRGGGDYRLENDYTGIWARDRISIESEVPEGFTELVPEFQMD